MYAFTKISLDIMYDKAPQKCPMFEHIQRCQSAITVQYLSLKLPPTVVESISGLNENIKIS